MAKQKAQIFWKQDRWNGGESEDSRIGNKGSGRYLLGCDIQADSGLLKVARKPTRHDSASTFASYIKWIVPRLSNGDVFYYAGDKIVKAAGTTYSANKTIAAGDSADGQGMDIFNSNLYAMSSTKIHKYDFTTWTDNWQTGLTASAWHPTAKIKNFLLIGHGRYVASIDDVGAFTLAKLTLPPDYIVRSMFRVGSFVAILAQTGTAISDSDDGMMFLWDGLLDQYNDYIPLDGNPHAGVANKNKITIIAGQEPSIQESLGGMAEIKQVIPNIGDGKTCEIWPGAIDTFRRMVYFGISDGTSTTVVRAVRSWGSKKSNFDPALNPEFPPSHGGVLGTTKQITAVKRIGSTIRFAWYDGTNYGIDYVDMASFQTEAVFRTLAFDNLSPYEKVGKRLMVEFASALLTNEYVTAKISVDPYGDSDFAAVDALTAGAKKTSNTVGDKILELPLIVNDFPIRSRDLHVELRPGGTGSTRPAIKRYWVAFDEDADQL